GNKERGAALGGAEGVGAALVVPLARRLPWRQRHADRRRGEPCRRRHRRTQRHALRLRPVPGLRRGDDAGVARDLPGLRRGPLLLTTLPPRPARVVKEVETAIHLLFAMPA